MNGHASIVQDVARLDDLKQILRDRVLPELLLRSENGKTPENEARSPHSIPSQKTGPLSNRKTSKSHARRIDSVGLPNAVFSRTPDPSLRPGSDTVSPHQNLKERQSNDSLYALTVYGDTDETNDNGTTIQPKGCKHPLSEEQRVDPISAYKGKNSPLSIPSRTPTTSKNKISRGRELLESRAERVSGSKSSSSIFLYVQEDDGAATQAAASRPPSLVPSNEQEDEGATIATSAPESLSPTPVCVEGNKETRTQDPQDVNLDVHKKEFSNSFAQDVYMSGAYRLAPPPPPPPRRAPGLPLQDPSYQHLPQIEHSEYCRDGRQSTDHAEYVLETLQLPHLDISLGDLEITTSAQTPRTLPHASDARREGVDQPRRSDASPNGQDVVTSSSAQSSATLRNEKNISRQETKRPLIDLNLQTRLWMSVTQNLVSDVKFLLQKGATPDFIGGPPTSRSLPQTPLCKAAADNNIEVMTLLLFHGADPNIVVPDSFSALRYACWTFVQNENVQIEAITMLLVNGANVDAFEIAHFLRMVDQVFTSMPRESILPVRIFNVLELILRRSPPPEEWLHMALDACSDRPRLDVTVWLRKRVQFATHERAVRCVRNILTLTRSWSFRRASIELLFEMDVTESDVFEAVDLVAAEGITPPISESQRDDLNKAVTDSRNRIDPERVRSSMSQDPSHDLIDSLLNGPNRDLFPGTQPRDSPPPQLPRRPNVTEAQPQQSGILQASSALEYTPRSESSSKMFAWSTSKKNSRLSLLGRSRASKT